jgi:hypothetical protein
MHTLFCFLQHCTWGCDISKIAARQLVELVCDEDNPWICYGVLQHNQDCLFQWYLWWCITDGMGKQMKFSELLWLIQNIWTKCCLQESIFLSWFRILVPDYGFMQLELIPIYLLGFLHIRLLRSLKQSRILYLQLEIVKFEKCPVV